MFTPEIALGAGTAGIFFALISCLLVLSTRRSMNRQLEELKLELDVHLSANHEMAKHLRALQKGSPKVSAVPQREPEIEDELPSPRGLEPESPERGVSLAEKLGLSQSEADIITHLRPRRNVRETV